MESITSPAPETGRVALLVGTRKGAFILTSDPARRDWTLRGPEFLGHIAHHVVLDPRDRRTLLVAARTGHLGPTVFRSDDFGKSFREASKPPAFPKVETGADPAGAPAAIPRRRHFEPLPGGGEPEIAPLTARSVESVFWLAPGHASEPGVWYAGTAPQGLFRSEDAGDTWRPVSGFNDHPSWGEWTVDGTNITPDGGFVHSILNDPRDPAHLYIGMSGGVFESVDGGADWKPFNTGCAADFLPDPNVEFGHDPHCVQLHPLAPDVLYQQNHCGIYRVERPASVWERIGDNMPKDVGDIGFPVTLHPRDPRTVWVFPMDGTEVWPRTSPGGKPATYVTRDAGKTWARQDRGLPREQAWYTVMRQGMSADSHDPVGIYFGTTSGEVWVSADEGERWTCIARHLPQIIAVEATALPD